MYCTNVYFYLQRKEYTENDVDIVLDVKQKNVEYA